MTTQQAMATEELSETNWRNYAGVRKEATIEGDGNHRYAVSIDVVVDGAYREGICAGGNTVTEFLQDALRQTRSYGNAQYIQDVGQPHFRITEPVRIECNQCFGAGTTVYKPGRRKICPTCKGKNSTANV